MKKFLPVIFMCVLAACGQPTAMTEAESEAFIVGSQCREGANNAFDPWINELEWQEYYDECMRSAGL